VNAIFLHLPDGTATKWSMCGNCGMVASPGNLDISEKCCTCYDCGLPLAKDERIPYADGRGNRSLYHRECERIRRVKRDAEMLGKAELVPDYDGPVYYEGRHGSYGDGYFADVDELAEDLDTEDDQSSRPEFAFCCEAIPFRGPDAGSIIESACEEMDEDASERIEGVEEFEKACAAFQKANEGTISWGQDRKHKVAVPSMVKE
jgi:hypothetical protein